MPFGRSNPKDDQRAIAYRDWIQQRHPFSIASIVLGIFSLLEFGAIPIFSLAAVVLGIMALKGSGFGVQGSGEGSEVRVQGSAKKDQDANGLSSNSALSTQDSALSSSPLNPEPRTLNPLLGRRLAITGILLGAFSFAIFIYLRTRPTGH